MVAIYDKIGARYSVSRREDPRIAKKIYPFLIGAESVLNIGAGSGSYEPLDLNVLAVEPSQDMIKQRSKNLAPVTQACAESLPFNKRAFTHSMSVLSIHHWTDRVAGFNEIKRVTKNRFVAVTWDPSSQPFWLTEAYFPEIYTIDESIFPSLDEFVKHFPGVKFYSLEIPADCIDGFTAAYWARPHAYLDPLVRSGMSTFSKLPNIEPGLRKLKLDIESGLWDRKYGYLRSQEKLDVGYKIAVWDAQQKQCRKRVVF